jgi:hypothetical protein
MKRLMILPALLMMAFAMSFQVQAEDEPQKSSPGFTDKLVLYVPNRIVSFFDIFSLDLGYGPAAKVDAQVTKAFDFAAGTGATSMAVKGYNRQYGFCLEKGYKLAFGPLTAEKLEVSDSVNNVQEFWYQAKGLPDYRDRLFNIETGARDYWALGFEGALFLDVAFYVHPVDVANFVTGFFFYTIKDNEYTLDNTSY